jgi:hypothetical protein
LKSISNAHRLELEGGSSITARIIEQRGYWTATKPESLRALGHGYSEDQCQLVPCLVIPIWGVDKNVVSSQIKPVSPRTVDGKILKYESPAGQPPRLDIHPYIAENIRDPHKELWITEGAKKADSAIVRGLTCIDLAGVWNWRGRNKHGGITELADWENIALKHRTIYIAFDSDVMQKREVLTALKRLAQFLLRRGARKVLPVIIPGGKNKVGLDDFFVAGGQVTDLRDCIDHELLDAVKITFNGRGLADVVTDTLSAIEGLNDPAFLFVRGGQLSRVDEDERGVFRVAPLSAISARNVLADAAQWVRSTEKADIKAFPPKEVAEAIVHLGSWPGIPPLISLASAPVLSRCGQISKGQGYDPNSKYYITSRESWPEWDGSASSAASFIFDEVLCDFPFAKEADRAHALALMLLPIVRPAISGPTPLHMIDAPVQGTGKSLLAEVCLMPTIGPNVAGSSGAGREEEEWRKKIITELLKGQPYIFFDNLVGKVQSASLAGAITSTQWSDRLLGTMTSVTLPVACVWVATGNNCQLDEDLVRRSLWIRLDAETERPEERLEFRHQDIKGYIARHRSQVLSALLGIVSDWVKNGAPKYTASKLGSFEDWSNTIGGILGHAGVGGFLSNLKELRESANPADVSWSEFYKRWELTYGVQSVKASFVFTEFMQDETLAGFVGGGNESQQKVKLGYLLRRQIGIVRGGLRVQRAGVLDGSASYRLERVAVRAKGEFGAPQGELEVSFGKVPFHGLGSNEANKGELGELGEFEIPLHMRARTHTHTGSDTPLSSQTPLVEPESKIKLPFKTPLSAETVIDEVII